jgi:hypothetical protein
MYSGRIEMANDTDSDVSWWVLQDGLEWERAVNFDHVYLAVCGCSKSVGVSSSSWKALSSIAYEGNDWSCEFVGQYIQR